MTSPAQLSAIAQDLIDRNRYLTLATADEAGQPWASPVWYAHTGYKEFFWASSPDARHSRNIAVRPQVSIVIFDSSLPPGATQAVYLSGAAEVVTGPGLQRHLQAYSRRSQEQGLPEWAPGDVQAPARHRLYRVVAATLFVLKPGGVDTRIPVTIELPAAHPPIGSAGPRTRVSVRPARYRQGMRYLMLLWADADATSGGESDFQAWADFDEQVKAAGAFVLNGALAPASAEARLVQTAIAGHPLGDAVQRRPFAEGRRQIQAFYIMDLPDMDTALEWANRLPTYGCVEVRELLQF
ncbi:MAG: pyridoxamine 5'-phosphate oxidase family protein [Trebonia sp.]